MVTRGEGKSILGHFSTAAVTLDSYMPSADDDRKQTVCDDHYGTCWRELENILETKSQISERQL